MPATFQAEDRDSQAPGVQIVISDREDLTLAQARVIAEYHLIGAIENLTRAVTKLTVAGVLEAHGSGSMAARLAELTAAGGGAMPGLGPGGGQLL